VSNWFLGWRPSEPLDWIADLRRNAPNGLRWFHPEDCHVTLAFFGRLSADQVRNICECLSKSTPEQFPAVLGKALLLPNARRFSALSFSIESDLLRSALAQQRGPWLAQAGVPPETRDPLPHLTFARPDRRASPAQLRAIRGWIEKPKAPRDLSITFEGPSLFTWADDRSQRQFKVVLSAGDSITPDLLSAPPR
jgi:2'-5' RNA ligase